MCTTIPEMIPNMTDLLSAQEDRYDFTKMFSMQEDLQQKLPKIDQYLFSNEDEVVPSKKKKTLLRISEENSLEEYVSEDSGNAAWRIFFNNFSEHENSAQIFDDLPVTYSQVAFPQVETNDYINHMYGYDQQQQPAELAPQVLLNYNSQVKKEEENDNLAGSPLYIQNPTQNSDRFNDFALTNTYPQTAFSSCNPCSDDVTDDQKNKKLASPVESSSDGKIVPSVYTKVERDSDGDT